MRGDVVELQLTFQLRKRREIRIGRCNRNFIASKQGCWGEGLYAGKLLILVGIETSSHPQEIKMGIINSIVAGIKHIIWDIFIVSFIWNTVIDLLAKGYGNMWEKINAVLAHL